MFLTTKADNTDASTSDKKRGGRFERWREGEKTEKTHGATASSSDPT